MNDKNYKIVAIIGGGPRGLSALESLYSKLAENSMISNVKTILFEETKQLGNGPVYDLNQPNSNWLNVSERGLTVPARKPIHTKGFLIKGFPSYQDWSGFDKDKDTGSTVDYFTTRSKMGKYLNERFQSIADTLIKHGYLKIINEKVIQLDYQEKNFQINTSENCYKSNEVVLTIGHQPTELDEQLADWKQKMNTFNNLVLVTEPYPVKEWRNLIKPNVIVGLRGFGLAMIDVARALTTELGGSFELLDEHTRKMKYSVSKDSAVTLIPFSLNGLPMTPKPLTLELDKPFIPSDTELQDFHNRLQDALSSKVSIKDHSFLIQAIAPLVAVKYFGMQEKAYTHKKTIEEIEVITAKWLHDESLENPLILSKSLSTYDSITAFVEMATGFARVSLDYCIGQVWRHCQPTIYKALSFTNLDDEVIAGIIQLDERSKRYTYGPPVDSLTQLLALVDAGTMNLHFVNDPKIMLEEQGWNFIKDGKEIKAEVMIETVLDSPKLLEVNSSIIKSLLNESLVEPVHNSLGIATEENGIVELHHKKEIVPLAVLGRLAKGTIIGVDAILECFGNRSNLWADGLVERFKN